VNNRASAGKLITREMTRRDHIKGISVDVFFTDVWLHLLVQADL